jgi:hypothetical protein
MVPIDESPTAPADCVLAFAIPTTAADFVRDLGCGPTKDFASHVVGRQLAFSDSGRWRLYERSAFGHVIEVIDKVSTAVAGWGVRVVCHLELRDLRPLLEKYPVVTLVTHSSGAGDWVEFHDGLYPLDEVVKEVPIRRGAILDLTICYSAALADAIKWRHPEWQVISNAEETSLLFRLDFYKSKIKLLTARPMSYLDADRVLRLALARSKGDEACGRCVI